MFRWERGKPRPLVPNRVVVYLDAPEEATVVVSTAQGTFSFKASEVPFGAIRKFLGGRATVLRAVPTKWLTLGGPHDDFPSLCPDGKGGMWVVWTAYDSKKDCDLVMARHFDGGRWGKPLVVSPRPGDFFKAKAALDGKGGLWVIWAENLDGNFELVGRYFEGGRWSEVLRLTNALNGDFYHSMAQDRWGNIYLCWQSFRNRNSDIYLKVWGGRRWSEDMPVTVHPASDWFPQVACRPDGRVYIVWDS